MTETATRQEILDQKHLRLLSLAYLVSAGTTAFMSLFALISAFIGAILARPGETFGMEVAGVSLAFFLLFAAAARLKWTVARNLKSRRGRAFCYVVAALSGIEIPFGTILGVFTFLVLARPSISQRFERKAAEAA